jgi:hypothetical protein
MNITPAQQEQWQKHAQELIEAARRNNGLAKTFRRCLIKTANYKC